MSDQLSTVDLAIAGHACQFFDNRDSLALTVAGYLGEGLEAHARVLAVMCPDSWDSTARYLRRQGFDAGVACASGQLTVLDAAATLATFRRGGNVDRNLFEESAGALVRDLAGDRRQLRVYGEMVDILAAEGDFRGALSLEALWNDLSARVRFSLFCGYSAVNFGNPKASDALRRTCRAHSRVRTNPRDVLANFLLQASDSGQRS